MDFDTWPGAFLAAVILIIWAFNVHADRENAQELREMVVDECANDDSPKACGKSVREALG